MLKFDRQNLVPVVIKDDISGEVLMVAFMNEEALSLTRTTGYTHFTAELEMRSGAKENNQVTSRKLGASS